MSALPAMSAHVDPGFDEDDMAEYMRELKEDEDKRQRDAAYDRCMCRTCIPPVYPGFDADDMAELMCELDEAEDKRQRDAAYDRCMCCACMQANYGSDSECLASDDDSSDDDAYRRGCDAAYDRVD